MHFSQIKIGQQSGRLCVLASIILAVVAISPSSFAVSEGQGAERPPRLARVLDSSKALREMQIYQLSELGLEVWIENQPPWEVSSHKTGGRLTFAAASPENYHPPAAMTFAAWPDERVKPERFLDVARSAIQHASRNFGLTAGEARTLEISNASHGDLSGLESNFVGRVQGVAMDVRIFVGQAPGKYPVVLTVYTLQGKMGNLSEVIRRSWENVAYR